MHRLLERQLKRHFGSLDAIPPNLLPFLQIVDTTYQESDADRRLTERSLELASNELLLRNQNLYEANEALQQLNKERTQFLNNAAHELSTPLTPIKLQIHMLRQFGTAMTPSQAKTVDILDRNFERLGHLVKDVLDAARIQSNHLKLRITQFDLAQTMRNAIENYAGISRTAGVELRLGPLVPTMLEGDAGRLGQVMDNLVSNAVKFTPRGGVVLVECHTTQDAATVVVTDAGRGIKPEDVSRLFKPFSQVEDPLDNVAGTGLGLFISRSIIEAHSGTIWAESDGPAKGSRFSFTVPLARPRTLTQKT